MRSSFNATETILDPANAWVRIAIVIAATVVFVAFGGHTGSVAQNTRVPVPTDGSRRAGEAGTP